MLINRIASSSPPCSHPEASRGRALRGPSLVSYRHRMPDA